MAFSIQFLENPLTTDEINEWQEVGQHSRYKYAEIKIGTFNESMYISTRMWQPYQYQHQWIKQLEELLSQPNNGKAGLITNFELSSDPISVWSLYREGDDVYINESMISQTSGKKQRKIVDGNAIAKLLGDRDRGASEWHTTTHALAKWLEQLRRDIVWTMPTRQQASDKLEALIAGKEDHIDVGLWAERMYEPDNEEKRLVLLKNDPVLYEFLETISYAACLDTDGTALYSNADYQTWLDEFREACIDDADKECFEHLKHIMDDVGVEYEFEVDKELWFISLNIKAASKMRVWMNRAKLGGKLYCSDLSFEGMQRESYPDNDSKLPQTSKEILETVESILKNKTKFHLKPSGFNSERGFINVVIDGRREQVMQDSNVFGLPVVLSPPKYK